MISSPLMTGTVPPPTPPAPPCQMLGDRRAPPALLLRALMIVLYMPLTSSSSSQLLLPPAVDGSRVCGSAVSAPPSSRPRSGGRHLRHFSLPASQQISHQPGSTSRGQGSDTEGQLAPGQAALRAPRAGEWNQKPYREAAEAPPSLAISSLP